MQTGIATIPSVPEATKVLRRGFTIVELLIVIVVIGILAAITIVAFSGVQDRARSAEVISLFRNYRDTIVAWSIENGGQFPAPNTGATCLGPAASFPSNACGDAPWWYAPASYDASFNQQLAAKGAPLKLGYWGGSPVGVVWYHSNYYGERPVIGYAVSVRSDCGLPNIQDASRQNPGSAYTSRSSEYTMCILRLN